MYIVAIKNKKKRYDEEGVRWVKNIQNSMRYELKHPKLYERERELDGLIFYSI